MSRGKFRREQNPMLTVEPDTDTSWIDNHNRAVRAYHARHPQKTPYKRYVPFVPNPKWNKCFSGR